MKKIKIVLTGPESTGKSTLTQYLAKIYDDIYLPEYAREYVEKLNRPYEYKDVEIIAQKQIELEKQYLQKAKKILFVDTSLIVTKVWFDFVYGKEPEWLEKEIMQNKADYYLLTNTEIEWEYDPVREHPGETRNLLFEIYKKELEKHKFKYDIIRGQGEERYKNAKNYVQNFLDTKHQTW